MKFDSNNPPREFSVGAKEKFAIKDCGAILLSHNEQVTFTTESGGEYDLTRKDWGFYATPSLDKRLISFGLHAVLIKNNKSNSFFVVLVEKEKHEIFKKYCEVENLVIVTWLDSQESLKHLEKRLEN